MVILWPSIIVVTEFSHDQCFKQYFSNIQQLIYCIININVFCTGHGRYKATSSNLLHKEFIFSFFIGLNDRLGKLRPIPTEEEWNKTIKHKKYIQKSLMRIKSLNWRNKSRIELMATVRYNLALKEWWRQNCFLLQTANNKIIQKNKEARIT